MSDPAMNETHLWIPTQEQEADIELRVATAYALGHVEGMLAMEEGPPAGATRVAIKQMAASFHTYLERYGALVPDADVKALLRVLDDLLQQL